jgi:hypothetical protein
MIICFEVSSERDVMEKRPEWFAEQGEPSRQRISLAPRVKVRLAGAAPTSQVRCMRVIMEMTYR